MTSKPHQPKPIPEEHAEMLTALAKIPDRVSGRLTWHQQKAWENHKRRWYWAMKRIDYLQMLELAYRPDDPFDSVEWRHPKEREWLTIHGDFYYAILRVLNKGFKVVKEKAISEGLDFPFDDPRQLFAQICREDANYGVSEILGTDEKECLSRVRTALSQEGALFRRGTKEANEYKATLKTDGWSGFWLYAIFDDRYKGDLRVHWQAFLKCHKAMCRFANQKNISGGKVRLVVPQWKKGLPTVPPYGHILNL